MTTIAFLFHFFSTFKISIGTVLHAFDCCTVNCILFQKYSKCSNPPDYTPPVYRNCPSNVYTVKNEAVIWDEPRATDNVGVKYNRLLFQSSAINGTIFPVGTHLIVYEAEDFQDNKARCDFFVIVHGNIYDLV